MAAKRRSVSTELGAVIGSGARAVDPLFEFDVPKLFVDLTQAPRYSTGHDPWFDVVHEEHSKPSYELAQEEAEVQQQQQQHKNRHRRQSSSGGTTTATIGLRGRTSAGSALNASAALEKENRIVAPKRHASALTSALGSRSRNSSSGGLSGLANSSRTNAGDMASGNQQQQQQQRRSATGTATVSGLPARLRRRSAPTPGNDVTGLATADSTSTASTTPAVGIDRVRAPVKTATVAAAVATTASLQATNSSSRSVHNKSVASRNKVRDSSSSSSNSSARFMAPTASSRLAAARKHAPADKQRVTTASRRPAASSSVASSAASSSNSSATDQQDLQALLARHNKKFKVTHTYQPPQHSVRDVRRWEKKTQQSYYDLSPDERVRANSEIAELVNETARGTTSR